MNSNISRKLVNVDEYEQELIGPYLDEIKRLKAELAISRRWSALWKMRAKKSFNWRDAQVKGYFRWSDRYPDAFEKALEEAHRRILERKNTGA